jgi:ParB-like chromosome segregation protein Spo0J
MIEFHPVASIFPLLQGDDFEALKADIAENGLIEPIWLHPDGRITDGRNRFRACDALGIEPRFRTYQGDLSPMALVRFVISLNEKRRHLSSSQRAAVAVMATEVVEMLEEEAKDRQRINGLNNSPFVSEPSNPEIFPDSRVPIRTGYYSTH